MLLNMLLDEWLLEVELGKSKVIFQSNQLCLISLQCTSPGGTVFALIKYKLNGIKCKELLHDNS